MPYPIIHFFVVTTFVLFNFTSSYAFASKPKIGVVVPLEHEAMLQIVSGIEESLIDTNVDIIVQNAHGDLNIQLALFKQMKESDFDIIMPIGTAACQMSISQIKNRQVVCIATSLWINKNKRPLITSLNDEIPITLSINKLRRLRNIAVIYSANEKVMPEIEELKKYAKENNITLHLAMVQTLIDLPAAVKTAPNDIQAFLILKDHIIVSAVSVIAQEAAKRSIPLIASDEGSVKNGATIAIGVKEKDIGIKSGAIVKSILTGTSPRTIERETMRDLTLFVNKHNFELQKILNIDDLKNIALPVIEVVEKN